MTFRQIGTVALDGVSAELQAKIGWHTEAAGSIETLNLPSRGTATCEGEEGHVRMGMGKMTGKLGNPAELNREVVKQRRETTLYPPTIGRSIVTASRTRRPTSAVIIDLAMYRAQRRASLGLGEHHESSQTRIAAHDRITSPPATHSRR